MSAFKDPPRLIDSPDVSSVVRDAITAGRAGGGPDPERLLRIEQDLARVAPGSMPSPPPGASTREARWVGHSRWLLLGCVGVASLGGVAALQAHGASAVTARAPNTIDSARPPRPLAFVGSTADRAPLAPDPAPRADTAAPAPAPTEGEEIALLARAHESLHERPAESLALCRKHETEFAGGRFAEEREAVAIEALVYLHRADDAERRFARFQKAYPMSSHRVHLADLFTNDR
jgi:hypothetical protein